MKNNTFIKLICSIPVILVLLYFVPFLGVCLILFRYYVHRESRFKTSILLLICGFLILIPKIVDSIIRMFNLKNIEIPYLNSLIDSDIYIKLLSFSKLLIIVSIICVIISYIFSNIFNKVSNKIDTGIKDYIKQDLQKDYEIRKENDMKMQEKRERAKNTHVVRCPYCGSNNVLTEKTGTCSFCRRTIENK